METLEGTLTMGIMAIVSLPIAVALMVLGLSVDHSAGEARPAHRQLQKLGEEIGVRRAA